MKSESIKELTAALAKAQLAFKHIKRTEKVGYDTKSGRKQYNYAPLSEVIEATKQGLSDNGLAIMQFTKFAGENIVLETLLSHSSGEWLSGELYVGKQDQHPQSEGAALTYKRRYGISAILCIASEDDDDAEAATGKEGKAEMEDGKPTVAQQGHWCVTHNIAFFKAGKMKGYAHKIEETGKWCNEPERAEEPPEEDHLTCPDCGCSPCDCPPKDEAPAKDISEDAFREGLIKLKKSGPFIADAVEKCRKEGIRFDLALRKVMESQKGA